MPQKPLNRSLDANLAFLDEMFGHSDDFYTKRLMIAGVPCAAIMFTGLSSPEKLWICWTATRPCWAAGRGCATTC